MKALIVGGSGLISTGIVRALRERKAEISVYNRGKRGAPGGGVRQLVGDRDGADFEAAFAHERYDAVIDMICFTPAQAERSVRAFGGRCDQFIFCSTVCTYSPDIPPNVLIDETWKRAAYTEYGRNKVLCEDIFQRAHEQKKFKVTSIRPSYTYGPGGCLIDQLDFSSATPWIRIEQGQPILCLGDGLGLWMATHRDDCGKLFAYAIGNANTYGKAYNATNDEVFTWRDYYRRVAAVLGKKAKLLFVSADWVKQADAQRCPLLDIARWHGAFNSSRAKADVPEYRCAITLEQGAKETLDDMRRRGLMEKQDDAYRNLVDQALKMGVSPVEA